MTAGESVACTANYGFQTGVSVSCTVDTDARTVVVANVESSDFLLILSLDAVQTPSFVATWPVIVSSYDSSGAMIPGESSGTTTFNFRTTPGDLSCSL